ncbi:protein NPAT [Brachyhypopomus gauderio]|uniref:protein NPAT n=1 Tax=Brachyhypopomus gauderio TaxID=698409 RepID=UPI0040428CC4
MLLPSDVARLVLGYLQQEGLAATGRAFIQESPNLREYAEHSTEDGSIPACVFSLFGKNLTTILNEYIAVKAKETYHENHIPVVMTSLWKKLDFTLSQIKSMQNSPAVQQIQRLRTQNSIQSLRRQRALTSSQPPGGLTVSTPGHCIASPVAVAQSILGHSTPVCHTSQQARPSTISLSQSGESTLQIIVPDHRIVPGPLSPARRKCDSPRRRAGSQHGASRSSVVSSSLAVEANSQETMTENISQMVIENAREKILSDRSLQEKLAENINKILASDNSPQSSKAACSTVEPEQSIDEILGLQGEIHMTDDAIQDILQQTESDPAFQALFDLFDCGKCKTADGGELGDGRLSDGAQETDGPDPGDSAMETGTGQEDSTSGRETNMRKLRSSSLQASKSKRKLCAPLGAGPVSAGPARPLPKRTPAARGSRQAKKGAESRITAPVGGQQVAGVGPAASGQPESGPGRTASRACLSDEGADMELDHPASDTAEVVWGSSPVRVTPEKASKNMAGSDGRGEPTAVVGADAPGSTARAEEEEERAAETVMAAAFLAAGQSTCEPAGHRSTHNTAVSSKTSWQQPATSHIPLLDTCTQETGGGPGEAPPSCAGIVSSELLASATQCPVAVSTPSTTAPVPLASVPAPSASVPIPLASVPAPSASVPIPLASVPAPSASVPIPLASVPAPSVSVPGPLAVFPTPSVSVPASLAVFPTPSVSVPASLAVFPAPSVSVPAPLAVVPASSGSAPASLAIVPAPLASVLAPLAAVPAPMAPVYVPSTAVSSPPASVSHPSSTASDPCPQTAEPDPSKIVALQIIISEEQEEQTGDCVLSQAVSSITGDPVPTIFLSSPAKSPSKLPPSPPPSISPEETAQAVSNLQGAESVGTHVTSSQLLHARPAGQDAGFVQLLPASSPFRAASSYLVVADPTSATGDHPSAVMLLPGSATHGPAPCTSHVVATPPRSRALVSMAANVPQSFTPASSIIISSPVSPTLQNMALSMSVFGHDSTGKLTVLPNQMLALPGPTLVNQPAKIVSKPKLMPKDTVELGKTGIFGTGQLSTVSPSSEQLKGFTGVSPSHRRILCFDETAGQTRTTSRTTTAAASRGVKEHSRAGPAQPGSLGTSGVKRRVETVRLPEQSPTSGAKESDKPAVHQQEKQAVEGTVAETDTSNCATRPHASVGSEPKWRPQSSSSREDGVAEPADAAQSSASPSRSPRPVTDPSREESPERRTAETPEDARESGTPQDSPGVTANKENELDGGRREHQAAAPSAEGCASARPATPASLAKPLCKTSPLTKQAAEMLQDIQSQTPTSTPPRRKGAGCLDLPLPRTPGSGAGRVPDDFLDGLRTPSRPRRGGRDAEGTPRHLPPPATPDLPSCSPASEAGSENSINMAAHTLMILSRAARTGGPLKDSLRQEEAGTAKSGTSSGKKRKHAELSPAAKKELPLSGSSGSKKKAQKRKKLLDSFPRDLDVDKFLSSLHYDE